MFELAKKNKMLLLPFFLLLFSFFNTTAQTNPKVPFNHGEEISYDIKFKYGLINSTAAKAYLKTTYTNYKDSAVYKVNLNFKTTSFFDNVYEIRDTMTAYINQSTLTPVFYHRILNEGSSHYKEDVIFRHYKSSTQCRTIRTYPHKNGFDTIMFSNQIGFDVVSMLAYVRSIDYSKLKDGDTFQFTIFAGKKKTDIICRYKGKETVKKNGSLKYKTHKFNLDIAHEVFEDSKSALELWLSDDSNLVPIKMKAKLKIGAAEIMIATTKNLKYSFSAEIKDK